MNYIKEDDGFLLVHLCNGTHTKVDLSVDRSIFDSHWTYDKTTGYAYRIDRTSKPLRKIYLHRLISGAKAGEHVDHQNRDKLDNRTDNLRVGTQKDNARNQAPRGKINYKGVFESGKNYGARIRVDERYICLGMYYKTPEEAAHAYNKSSMKYFPETGIINPLSGFIDESIPDGNYIDIDGVFINVTTVSKILGVIDKTMFTRKHRGWTDRECIAGVRENKSKFEELYNQNKLRILENA